MITTPPTTIQELLSQMEQPAAKASVDTLHNTGLDRVALVSSAISLKRIADALEVVELDSHEVISLPQILLRIAKAVEKPTISLQAGHGISLEESLTNAVSNLSNTLAEHRVYSK